MERTDIVTAASLPLANSEDATSLVSTQLLAGQKHYDTGEVEEAIAAFRCALEAAKGDAGCAIETVAALHAKLGNCHMVRGQLDLAAESYKSALRLVPHLTSCWCNLGNVYQQTGRSGEAVTLYLQGLQFDPAHWPSRTNLVQALMAGKQHIAAKALLLELAEERPQDGAIAHQLGKACFALNEPEAALRHFQQAITVNPRDAESLYWIGGIMQTMGHAVAAQAAYASAAQLKPLIRRSAAKSPADFRVLALYAPFAGNTPSEYLFKDAAYDTDTLALFASSELDARSLGDIQLVVNLISDADQAKAELPLAARLVQAIGKPVVNEPAKIQRTTRDAVADLLRAIPDCRIPGLLRLPAGAGQDVSSVAALLPFSCPILVRPAGTHGGDDFEKLESLSELASFLAQRPDSDHYVIEYIDYASADGHFRKYRFIFVDAEILPYHLAIGSDWKVHHDATDMPDHPWMQQEEAAFLANPGAIFDARHYQALRAIRELIGLDFFGIDCGLDATGNLVVFEVNASMLVHEDNATMPYKDPFVRAIKTAFDAMLQRRAGCDLSATSAADTAPRDLPTP
jgi:Flp pilus assembly protein TadD/glutathione synthase/RimK-type ligase-like ATP-grasp enzyme